MENNTFEINRLCGLYGQATRWGLYDINYIAPTLTAAAGMGGGHTPMVFLNERYKNDCHKTTCKS